MKKRYLDFAKLKKHNTPSESQDSPIPPPDYGEGKLTLEELQSSESQVGQIFPVIKDQYGNILDGFHRKRTNPNWRETTIQVKDKLHALRIRVHANILRREVERKEKQLWVSETRKVLQESGLKGTQEEIADALGMSQPWVSLYDIEPTQKQDHSKVLSPNTFFGYNVWGFKDESWRELVLAGDPNQPDKEFYHGSTPAFVIHQLITMFEPKTVLDSMAGVGTTGYVCEQYGIDCDQFDIYPYPKYGVEKGDAEHIEPNKTYDLIFNHIPYLRMVKYGDAEEDLSTHKKEEFLAKLERIFKKNFELLNNNGIYAVLVGDWRHGNQIQPLTAEVTVLGRKVGFVLYDEAIKLTAEQKGVALQEYRATKFGYLAQTFDMVLIFKKV